MDLFRELRRRKVIDTTVAYLLAAVVVGHVTRLLVNSAYLPDWVLTAVLSVLLIALPVVIALAWRFDITGLGIEITGQGTTTSRLALAWQRIALPLTILFLLAIAIFAFLMLNAGA